MLTYEVFMLEDGAFGYTISYEGTAFIRQTFAPGVGGYVPMTEAEAHTYAQAQVAELLAGLEEPPADDGPPVGPRAA